MKRSRCLVNIKNPLYPKITLVCFPYAGGSAGVFHGWAERLPDWIRLVALEMPGRGARFGARPFISTNEVIAEMMEDISEHAGERLVFFGHSLGALIAFEAARHLEKTADLAPELVFVSGRLPPHLGENKRTGAYKRKQARNFLPVYRLDDSAFIDELRLLNGTPQGVLENAKLMELCLPYLRADFRINDEYQMIDLTRLNCPLITMGGEEDFDVPLHELRCWAELTEGSAEHHVFPGDHFFTHSHEAHVVSVIVSAALNLLNVRPSAAGGHAGQANQRASS